MAKHVTNDQKLIAEKQIKQLQKDTDYKIKDYVVGYLIQEFQAGSFLIPLYQRDFIWPKKNKVQFVESLILGIPIPMMFAADLEDGRLEIIDGAQRIQTLEAFLNDDLELSELPILDKLNGFKFSDLPEPQQRKFKNKAMRLVILAETTSEERRQELFRRLNTGGIKAKSNEIRRSHYDTKFMKYILKCTNDKTFQELCPVTEKTGPRREREELALRFFAYSNSYKDFKHDVGKFLTKYLEKNKNSFDVKEAKKEFDRTMRFVKKYFPYGFTKGKTAKSTPRVRFEAIAVGVNLALRINPGLDPSNVDWINSEDFVKHTTTHASNSGPKLRGRIEYVRDILLRGDNG